MYDVYHVHIDEEFVEVAQALMAANIDMDGVTYEDDGFSFYVESDQDSDDIQSHLQRIQKQFPFSYYISKLEDKNWNAQWESDFKSVEVEQYCRVRAPFHQADPSFQHDIIIHPGMAFGTGHHETTWMMIDNMSRIDMKAKRVLDAGCGTGVLAILAAKEGASHIDAFDYDKHSSDSATLNKGLNAVNHINVVQSDVSSYEGDNYDVIVANINRNVIISSMHTFAEKLAYKGMIIVSGYLEVDIEKVESAAQTAKLVLVESYQRGEWISQVYRKG